MSASRLDWFRPRFRHVAIGVAFLALVAGILVPLTRILGRLGLLSPQLLLLVAAPWLLGLLVLLIERRSPVKFWAAPLLVAVGAVPLVLWLNSVVMQGWTHRPSVPALLATLLTNIAFIGGLTVFLRDMCPRNCPECRTRSMIPLRGFLGSERRTRRTFWCGSCGAAYWRTMAGEWKKERRRTWVDLAPIASSAGAGKDGSHFDTGSRVIAPVVRMGGKHTVPVSGAPRQGDRSEVAMVANSRQKQPGG
jgi:hypothetical protein